MDTQVSAPASKETALALPQATAIANSTSWEVMKYDLGMVARAIKQMIQNGKSLTDVEAIALARFSTANDLNPMAQEAYYIPGIGATAGIAGWRKKAQEQVDYEAHLAGYPGGHYTVEYEKADPVEHNGKAGDIAWKCTVKDSVSGKRYRTELYEAMRMLQASGVEDNYHEALKLVGVEPSWYGVGVVAASESFGGAVDKFDRHERAKKRAEKIALRKRFPRIRLPEYDADGDDHMNVDVSILQDPNPPRQLTEGEKRQAYIDLVGQEPPENFGKAYTREDAAKDSRMVDGTVIAINTPRPWTPEILKGKLLQDSLTAYAPTQEQIQSVARCLDYCFQGSEGRLAFISWMAEMKVTSSKDIADKRLLTAIHAYLQPKTDDTGAMIPTDKMVETETALVAEYLNNDPRLF